MVSHLSEVVSNQDEKINKIELNNMKKSVVLVRLCTSTKKGEAIREVNNFFKEEMGISPRIEDIFFLSTQSTSNVSFIERQTASIR